MNVRIQAKTGYDATQLLIEGCKQLESVCNHLDDTYTKALETYYSNNKPNDNINQNNNQSTDDINVQTSKKSGKMHVKISTENDSDDSDNIDTEMK